MDSCTQIFDMWTYNEQTALKSLVYYNPRKGKGNKRAHKPTTRGLPHLERRLSTPPTYILPVSGPSIAWVKFCLTTAACYKTMNINSHTGELRSQVALYRPLGDTYWVHRTEGIRTMESMNDIVRPSILTRRKEELSDIYASFGASNLRKEEKILSKRWSVQVFSNGHTDCCLIEFSTQIW